MFRNLTFIVWIPVKPHTTLYALSSVAGYQRVIQCTLGPNVFASSGRLLIAVSCAFCKSLGEGSMSTQSSWVVLEMYLLRMATSGLSQSKTFVVSCMYIWGDWVMFCSLHIYKYIYEVGYWCMSGRTSCCCSFIETLCFVSYLYWLKQNEGFFPVTTNHFTSFVAYFYFFLWST